MSNIVRMRILWLSLVVGVLSLVVGLIRHSAWKQVPFSQEAAQQVLIFLVVSMTVFSCLAFLFRSRANALPAMFIAGLAVLFGADSVFAVALVLGSSFLLGESIYQKLISDGGERDENTALKTCIGLGVYAVAGYLVISLPINSVFTYLLLFMSVIAVRYRRVLSILRHLQQEFAGRTAGESYFRTGLMYSLLAIYACASSLPETGHDALAMHLYIPTFVEHASQWTYDVSTYVWAVMPMGGNWLYTYVYLLSGERGVRLLNFALLVVILFLMHSFARVVRISGHANIVVILVLAFPLAYLETASLFIENAWAVFVLGAVLSLFHFIRSAESGSLLVCGGLAGVALSTKLQTIFLLPVMGVVFFLHHFIVRVHVRWPAVLAATAAVVMFGCAPYINAFMRTGNPIFPFYNAVFKSPFYDSTSNFAHSIFEAGIGWRTLYDVTFNSSAYLEGTLGSIGFTLLALLTAALVAIILYGNYIVRLLTLTSFLVFCLTFLKLSYLRYVYPIMPLFFLLIAYGLTIAMGKSRRFGTAYGVVLLLTIPLNVLFLSSSIWAHRDFPIWNRYIRMMTEKEFVEIKSPVRRAVDYINSMERSSELAVAFFSTPAAAGLRAKPLFPNWYNSKFAVDISSNATSRLTLARTLELWNAHLIVLDDNYTGVPSADLAAISTELARWGSISVRRLRPFKSIGSPDL